jgi:ABC-type bacteriocin/lantibiotic exporter with double-glycine peptidase domain
LSSPAKEAKKPPNLQRLKAVWPEVWKLMRPRRALLALGFVLMVINKVAGFVLPYSTKPLIDEVVAKHRVALLPILVVSVLVATMVQGVT